MSSDTTNHRDKNVIKSKTDHAQTIDLSQHHPKSQLAYLTNISGEIFNDSQVQ